MKSLFYYLWILPFILTSCLNVKKFQREMELFQTGFDSTVANYQYKDFKLKAGDVVQIALFTQASTNQEQTSILSMGGSGKTAGLYTVNNQGQIEFPKIGLQTVEGLTTKELKSFLQNKWSPFVKDIMVNVQLQTVSISLFGEFKNPGMKQFNTEKITLLDALSTGGGVTDDGILNNVLVIREENAERKTYRVDLTNVSFYKSPVFQLQQNDILYVSAKDSKYREKAMNEVNMRSNIVLKYLSFFNVAVGVVLLVTTLTK